MRDRNIYHPVNIRSDFVRKNAFEVIFGGSYDPLRILCKTVTVTLPKTNAVQVPWISGIMQLAGRISSPYTFQATFLVGRDNKYDTLKELYRWRNDVFNHTTGRIALAHEYKKEATIYVYDVTADADENNSSIQYTVYGDGVWPIEIPDLTFDVSDDTVLEVQASFAADKLEIVKFSN